MKPIVQRRRSTPSAITKALGKSRHLSREHPLFSSHSDNGLPSRAFRSPGSTCVLEERVQLTAGLQTQERHLVLLRDVLLVAKPKSSSSLKLKKQVPLSEVWTGTCLGEVTEKKMGPENSFVLGWPTTNYVVTFRSGDLKERWLSALLWHISEAKQKEHLKSLTLQISVLDADSCSSAAAVSVSSMETAESVIKRALQQLGLPDRASDHHLWVTSGKEDPAYPLIGHEHPFSIALSCLRDSAARQQGANSDTLLADGTEASCLERLPKGNQCQFILKPRLQGPVQLSREPLRKHTGRKKSLIEWALRRGPGTPTGSPPSQSPATPRKLFGLALSSVCPDGILPKPIMDMLLLLYHEGPSTRGIFRRSANAKMCKELKEKLNSGDDVRVDGESVFVAAAVITDFLRNIPDSVLSSDMHGLWMEAVDTENRAHKIEVIKGLVKQLPEANLILLRHLFGVLQHIEQNSGVNQMTAFNLALCIAPNMLWLPSPTGPEEESRSTKKVALLVQFLIENSGEIFGGDVASLFQRPDQKKSSSSEEPPDAGSGQHDESSDELEFSACDPEGPGQQLIPDPDDLFAASSSLLLEGQEDWDLFSEITACYQSQAWRNASSDSYDLLEEDGSFCSVGSIRSLSPARDRCSSEPSVCLSSQLPAQSHEPVARQSSCDATIMRSHTGYVHRLRWLQMESQKLLDEDLSLGISKARQNSWQSPQSSSQITKLSLQKPSLSNRSSFSSLSSTTASPSASSLSSLDSTFSCCSEPPALSPAEVPLAAGTAARLRAVSPGTTGQSPKEWHKPFAAPVPLHQRSSRGNKPTAVGSSHCSGERASFRPVGGPAVGIPRSDAGRGEEGPLGCAEGLGSQGCARRSHRSPELPGARPAAEKPLQGSRQRGARAAQGAQSQGATAGPPSPGSLKRTEVTFYVAPSSWGVPGAAGGDSSPASSGEQSLPESWHSVRVRVPQAVFYGQESPLALRSSPGRCRRDPALPSLRAGRGGSPQSAPAPERLQRRPGDGAPARSSGSDTFGPAVHIVLPAAVRSAVRGYFERDEPRSCPAAAAEAVERELLRSRAGRLGGQPQAEVATPERDAVALAQETFV